MVSKPHFFLDIPEHSHRHRDFEHREILFDQSIRSPVDRSLSTSAVPVANVNRDRRENAAGGKEKRKKKGRERDERLVRRDDFARESRHEPRGNWTRQMSHIRADSIKCRRRGTRAIRGTRYGGASLLKLNWTVLAARARRKDRSRRNETKLRNSPQAAHRQPCVYPVVPPRIDATKIDFFVTQPQVGGGG